jgi:hypothetical protein
MAGDEFDFNTGRWIAALVLVVVALPLSLPAWMELRFSVVLAAALASLPLGMLTIAGALFWGRGPDGFTPAFATRLIQLAGILLIIAAFPLGYAAGLADMENTIGDSALDLLLSLPVLLFVFGFALLWGARIDRYGLALVLAVLMPVDVALIVIALPHLLPPDPAAMDTTLYQPDTVIPAAPMMPAQQSPPSPVVFGPQIEAPGRSGCRRNRHKKRNCEAPPVPVVVIRAPSAQSPVPVKPRPGPQWRNAAPPVTSPARP